MGILVKRNKAGKYRFWTTISDGYLTKWLTFDEAVDYLAGRINQRAEEEIAQLRAEFPRGYAPDYGKRWMETDAELRAKPAPASTEEQAE
jgi:hypothetical protein